MMKIDGRCSVLLVMLGLSTGCSVAQRQAWAKWAQQKLGTTSTGAVTTDEVGQGLKAALDLGAAAAAQRLSQRDGYYSSPWKILLPQEAQMVTQRLQAVPGYAQLENELVLRLNRAAENAATRAQPIFVDAIRGMTLQDVWGILNGPHDAATRYLERTTSSRLFQEFQPVVQQSLDVVNARTYWREAASLYNRIPLVTPVNPSLDDHVTRMALQGLFALVAEKEKGIRVDLQQRTTALLQRVFSYVGKTPQPGGH